MTTATPGGAGNEAPLSVNLPQGAGARRRRERLLRGRTLAERRRERRHALLDAALELFGTKGYAATTIDEVCRNAYVSTRNFYEEFENRNALLVALSERIALDALQAFVEADVEPGPDLLARRIRARFAAVVDAVLADPRVARVAFVETWGDGPLRRRILATFPLGLRDFLAGHLTSVGMSPARQRANTLAVCGAVAELMADWVLQPDHRVEPDELVDHIVEVATRLLELPRPGAASP